MPSGWGELSVRVTGTWEELATQSGMCARRATLADRVQPQLDAGGGEIDRRQWVVRGRGNSPSPWPLA